MSLLIKALDKAQEEKNKLGQAEAVKQEQAKKRTTKATKVEPEMAEAGAGLTLSPPDAPTPTTGSTLESSAAVAQKETPAVREPLSTKPTYKPTPVSNPSQTQAANVFSSKRIEATNQNAKLAIIAGAGLIALLAMGAYYYQFIDTAPDVQLPPPHQPPIVATPSPVNEPAPTLIPSEVVATAEPEQEMAQQPEAKQAFEQHESVTEPTKLEKNKKIKKIPNTDETLDTENTLDANEEVVIPNRKIAKSNMVKMDRAIASQSASIQVTQSKSQDAVNPLVMRAYEAYNVGNDSEAQKLYKQALQRDGLNLDALLGLGAIATRQGRVDDANGWYRKVLDVDPKNSIAQAALLDLQQQQDPQSSESRFKSLIARSPNDANLHAALGNLYAEQNQWSAAQQAYFDAFRLNESADNAFNLAVSLDQMGKPKLALPYYQQALQMAQQSSASSIDKAALEARIAAIQ